MARPPLSAEQTRQTRESLLRVAQELYEQGGIEAMSFRAIAARMGCSTTMPYSYFASKADIVDGVRIAAYGWIRDVISVAASSAEDPIDALQALAAAYVRAGVERPRLYELLYSDAGLLDETDPRLVEAKLAALGVCQQVIEAAAASAKVLLTFDPTTTAHLFWVAAHGLVSLQTGGFLVVGRTVEQLLPALFAAMSVGVTQGATDLMEVPRR